VIALALALAVQDTAAAPRVLDTLVVRAGVLEAVPLSRNRLTPRELAGLRAGFSLDESLVRLPGVVAQSRGTFALDTRLAIRGAGARSPFGVRGVTVILDGVPQTLPDGQANLGHLDAGSIGSLELVRGAAGAFFGNAAGGALLVTSLSPFTHGRRVRARATAGAFGAAAFNVAAGSAGAGGGLTVSAAQNRQDGYRAYSRGLLRQAAVSGVLRRDVSWLRGQLRVADLARAENPGALDSAQLAANPRQANARNVAFAAGKRATEWQYSLDARGRLGRGSATAMLFGIARALDNPLASAWVKLDRRDLGLRFEYQWNPANRWQVRAGLDAQRQHDHRRNFANDSGRIGATATLDQRETVTAAGARAAALVTIGAASTAHAGLRYDRITFRVRDRLTADGDASAARAMDAVSWSAALERRFGGWRTWASAGTAFETPTTTELARPGTGGFDPDLAPQRTLQGEIGAEWAAGRGRLAVSLYRSTVTDGLVQREEPTMPGRFYFVNAARVALRGVEAEGSTWLGDWVALTGALTLTDHVYDRFPTDSTPLDRRFVPGLPRVSGYALASFGWVYMPRGPQLDIELVAQGRTWADDANTAFAPAVTQLHLRAGWTLRRLAIFGGVRNVTDARVVGSVNVNGAARRFFEPAPGRTSYIGIETHL
jgi:iron complex outermembrane recepter protein